VHDEHAASTVAMHGLTITTEYALRAPTTDEPPDVTLTRLTHDVIPTGPVVLQRADSGYNVIGYRQADGSLFVRTDDIDVVVNARSGSVAMRAKVESLASLFAEGHALTMLLAELGYGTLHANAVSVDDRAYAIAGVSGRGKSTTAGILLAAGARAVADDLVRVELGETVSVYPGSRGIRLRPPTAGLAELLATIGLPCTKSADGRFVIDDRRHLGTSPLALSAVVIPAPSRSMTRVAITKLTATDAVVALLRATRMTSWLPGPQQRHLFDTSTALARRVPVLRAEVPWGPPWLIEHATELRDRLATASSSLQRSC
jgi:hypothetical protein